MGSYIRPIPGDGIVFMLRPSGELNQSNYLVVQCGTKKGGGGLCMLCLNKKKKKQFSYHFNSFY